MKTTKKHKHFFPYHYKGETTETKTFSENKLKKNFRDRKHTFGLKKKKRKEDKTIKDVEKSF